MVQVDDEGRTMNDRGAKALAEREAEFHPQFDVDDAATILGNGLFIEDVTKHEPEVLMGKLVCFCGWLSYLAPDNESYFDHIGATK